MKENKKLCKRFIALALGVVSGVSLVACKKKDSENTTIDDVEIWSCWATEKVLQDNVEIYDELKQEPNIDVSALRGEVESAQIIMTTGEKSVSAYDVTTGDLKSTDGTVFAKSNIAVHHEKYVEVAAPAGHYIVGGYFPDCLVPFENIKAVGENVIAANNNQGLYINFDIPEDQPAGTYTGSLAIEIGGKSKVIPITLTVGLSGITEETHTLSYFNTSWFLHRGELDTTQEMFDKYNEFLMDYRLGCTNVLYRAEYHGDAEIQRYAEKACEYAKLEKCCGYNIPRMERAITSADTEFEEIWSETGRYADVYDPEFIYYFDPDYILKYFRAMAYEGLKQNVDPFEKAVFKGSDEPELKKVANYTNRVYIDGYILKKCKQMMKEELLADTTITDVELRDQIIESMINVPHILACSKLLPRDFDLEYEDVVYCPVYSKLETQYQQDSYRIGAENDLWWYGTVEPDPPYPSYHIDDTLLSARLLSWMQYDYNIQGNLYWAANNMSYGQNGPYGYGFLEDYHNRDVISLGTAGDGFVMYPGKKYGVDGPLSTIRLEAIRDGMEEYEFWYYLHEKYAEISKASGVEFDEKTIMKQITAPLYSGSKVSTTNEVFANARTQMISLLDMANSSAKLCIADYYERDGKYVYEVFAANGYTPQVAGEHTVTNKDVTGGKIYTLAVSPSVDGFKMSVEADGASISFGMGMSSSSTVYNAEYFYNNEIISKPQGDLSFRRWPEVTLSLVDATSVNANAAAGTKYIQCAMTAGYQYYHQTLEFVDDNTIRKMGTQTDKFVMELYNGSQEEMMLDIMFEYSNEENVFTTFITDQFKPGLNSYSVNNMYAMNWAKYGNISRVRIRFYTLDEEGNKVLNAARDDIYFVGMSVYEK